MDTKLVHRYKCINMEEKQLLIDVVLVDKVTGNKSRVCKGLLDTGAIGTCISDELAKEMRLEPLGTTTNTGSTGISVINYYKMLVDFNDGYIFEPEYIYEFIKGDNKFDAIIGMDIIGLGDFMIQRIEGGYDITMVTPIKKPNN